MSRITDRRRALALLCRKVNPPHVPEVYRTLRPGDWVEGGIDLGQVDWRFAYLRGLDTHNLRLPEGDKALWGAILREEERPRQTPPLFPVTGALGDVTSMTQLVDGSLVVGTSDGYVVRLEPGTGKRQFVGKHNRPVLSVCGLEGGLLASGASDHTVRIWDVKSGEALRTLEGHSNGVLSVCGLEGGLLASGASDHTVRIWDVTRGEGVRTLEGHGNAVSSVCGLEGGLLASGSDDNTVRIWDGKSGEALRILEGHSNGVRSVCDLEGGLLASGSSDNTVRIWDGKSGEALRTLKGHSNWVLSVCGLEGGLLASGSYDKTVRIWDVKSGRAVQVSWAYGDVHVRVHRELGITVSASKKAFDVQKVGNHVLPADKALYERISFAVRDKAQADAADGPISYVPLYSYNPGTPGDPDAPWYWHDESYRALTCPWPKDAEMRKRVMALYLGDEGQNHSSGVALLL
jgi:hypothetical protein